MRIDTVDIGGAAARGRPPLPESRTIEFDDNGVPRAVDTDGNILIVGRAVDVEPLRVAKPSEGVQSALTKEMPGVVAAYPDAHPGNRSDMKRAPGGALWPEKGQQVSNGPDSDQATQDIRQPVAAPKVPAVVDKNQTEAFAVDKVGRPVIEVVYHTEIGAVVSYYHRVEQSGRYLALIVDNRCAAAQRFIPKPAKDDSIEKSRLSITVTGKDKKEINMTVIPLDINITLDYYDISLMLVVQNVAQPIEN